MTHLINAQENVVSEALDGFGLLQPNVRRLAGRNVVVRADQAVTEANRSTVPVALISGGGSGHEPAHAGYVADGMLAAAVAGEIFSSPSVDAVLDAIRAVTGDAGALLIVKSYTGDRLNFGLAAEIARSEGLDVEVVVVGEDAALGDSDSHAGRRGLAGTVYVHKIAGAAARSGAPLREVAELARAVAARVRTFGVGASDVEVPGAAAEGRLTEGEVELGLGIHGEAGIEKAAFTNAAALVDEVSDRLVRDLGDTNGAPCAVLLGNVGGTSVLEMGVLAREAYRALTERGVRVERFAQGPVMTSLSTRGFSLSVLPLEDGWLERLDEPTESLAWPGRAGTPAHTEPLPVPSEHEVQDLGDPDDDAAARINAVCTAILEAEGELTRLDQVVGDGDLGQALARGAKSWQREPVRGDAAAMLREWSTRIRRDVGGTSGPLYAVGLLAASEAVAEGKTWAEAFRAGVDAVMELGGAKPGEKTMVDALDPAADAASGGLSAAVEAARTGVERTRHETASKGRASYLGERVKGEPDPGAVAVVVWLEALQGAGR
ncbi:dihydroxyacetone kinase family protein [Arthrobacter sp. UM1]|uniref:dihydroxyacetone kinase family protein n=1 Tax=Arthrobacter sp. UM1 TaxID=2766776 RepID=UPI001CF6C71C|nr:dihydroxyacetone kinase family protein [Arthrobacter sp. UM1]MCB4207416.1 dihydroxyacetone kinase subunit DhaK [Arthrobacter sp. UM1]